jgi:hypothetical protein
MAITSTRAERSKWRGGNMKIKTSGLGLIVLGILLLGAQLVLYLGAKNVVPPPDSGEIHLVPKARTTLLPAIVGALCLIGGLALVARKPEEADDPTDGLSIPEEAGERVRRKAS